MNRSLVNVLFGGINSTATQEAHKIEGTITKTTVDETVDALANADSVILVRPSRTPFFFPSFTAFRSLDMEWQWPKLNMPFQKSLPCYERRVSMSE